ncbi:hypothetical protein [Streptomyces sp. NPDC048603]|uniref:hypothetical protein n=1 Tax=Streptomyces sp. NPDC048603 TaxID=3365577 RepID=UPI0037232915
MRARAQLNAVVTAAVTAAVTVAVLSVAGCRITVEDDPATGNPGPGTGGQKSPSPKNPSPKGTVTPKPVKPPKPWVPKGPATLVGCGTHASGYQCTFHGYHFKPGEKVRFTRGFEGAGEHVFTADEDGEISTNLTSNTRSGTYTYVARGLQSDRHATTTVRITPGLWG